MIKNKFIMVLAALMLPASLHAQQSEGAAVVQIRAVLHDPVNMVFDFFTPDQAGGIGKVNLTPSSLSPAQMVRPVNGSLVFYSKNSVDPKNPGESLAASAKLPPNIKSAIVIVMPGPPDTKPSHRMVILDDSPAGFPKGESRALSLVPVETAIEAGEHKLPISPGKVTNVPAVKKVNEFNMAQTNFYYKDGEKWSAFTERQLQYIDAFRRIFIIHVTPGSTQPFVTTIVDTAPSAPTSAPP